jgi:uncharacterized protein (DUF58 family)
MILLLAVVLLLAAATGESVLYRLTYFLGLGIVGSYAWLRLSLSRLEMTVEMRSSTAEVGGVLRGSIYVRNDSRFPTGWLEVLQRSDMPGYVFGEVTRLPARGWVEWKTQGTCHTRGLYAVGPLVASGSDPLGLFRVDVTRGKAISTVIYPPVVRLPHFSLPVGDLVGGESIQHRPQMRSAGASSVREYAPGDNLNRIHWYSTAKYNKLMTKEFDHHGGGDVWVVLDLDQRVHISEGMERTDEYAVAIAASLAHEALMEGCSVSLAACGDEDYMLPAGGGVRQMSRILEMLTWSKTKGVTPLADVLAQNTMKLRQSASLLVVTSSTEMEWVSALESLTGRNIGIVVVLVDPMSFGGDRSCCEVMMRLAHAGILAYVVRKGDAIASALSRPVSLSSGAWVDEQFGDGELASASELN